MIAVSTDATPQTIRLQRSTSSSLCTLACLTSSDNKISIGSLIISKDSNNADFNIIPVSRSYENHKWERVAGPYAETLQINNCDTNGCDIIIPALSNLDPHKFVLMTKEHSLSSKEEVSRFLMQATFGPTMSEINDFGSPTESNFEQWIHSQIDLNPTYHREFFRENAHTSMYEEKATSSTRPGDPCLNNSRWREYAFTADDNEKTFTVTQLSDGKFLLSVESVPRTVVDSWKDFSGTDLGTGDFTVCKKTEETVGGEIRVKPDGAICKKVKGGNPKVNIPGSILNDENYSNDLKTIPLPSRSNFEDVKPLLIPNQEMLRFGSGLRLTSKISDSTCNQLPVGDYENLVGIISGEESQVIYAGYMDLQTNTPEKPIGVTGGADFETVVICPNPEKSFLNCKY